MQQGEIGNEQVRGQGGARHGRVTLDRCPVACREVAAVKGREPSLLPEGRKFKLVWNDEFIVDYVRVYDLAE